MTAQRGLIRPMILGILLGVGFAIAWGMVNTWVLTIVQQTATRRGFEHLFFSKDGKAIIVSIEGGRFGYIQLYDLTRNLLDISDDDISRATIALLARSEATFFEEPSWRNRVRSFADNHNPPIYWYFVSDGKKDGSAYLVGYNSWTKTRIGFLGTGGFREHSLPAEEHFSFPWHQESLSRRVICQQEHYNDYGYVKYPYHAYGNSTDLPSWYVYIHAADNIIYRADLEKRSVQIALERLPIWSMALFPELIPNSRPLYRLIVRTDDTVILFNGHNELLRKFPIPQELRDLDITLFFETTTGGIVAYTTSPYDLLKPEMHYRLFHIDPKGQVTRTEEAVLESRYVMEYMKTFLALVAPLPVVVDVVVAIVRPLDLLRRHQVDDYPQALAQAVGEFWPSLLLVHLLSAWLAWLCYQRQVRFATGKMERIIWPVFVFVCGLPGWIGYRYGRWWPRLERCPSCAGEVPRDRVECARCQADFPLPAPRGTEVFA